MQIDFKQIRESLSVSQVIEVVESLGGELRRTTDEYLLFTSILYHPDDANMHKPKMYYYFSTYTFMDYKVGACFDIFELVKRRQAHFGQMYNMGNSAVYIGKLLGFSVGDNTLEYKDTYNYMSDLRSYIRHHNAKKHQTYDLSVLNQFEVAYHQDWLDDGITIESMEKYNIRFYNPNQIVIPCQDIYGDIIGIRSRNLDPTIDWKYMPLQLLNGKMFNFDVGEHLYGLNYNRKAIERYKKVIIFEAEKSVLQCDGFFGEKNIAVAKFGSAFKKTQRDLLLNLGVEEVIIANDFDYVKVDPDAQDWIKFNNKAVAIAEMFNGLVSKITCLVEYEDHKLKASPSDLGFNRFMELYKNREEIILN